MIDFATGVVVIAFVFALSYWRGYEYGVKETEERWRDAVGRANEARRR